MANRVIRNLYSTLIILIYGGWANTIEPLPVGADLTFPFRLFSHVLSFFYFCSLFFLHFLLLSCFWQLLLLLSSIYLASSPSTFPFILIIILLIASPYFPIE